MQKVLTVYERGRQWALANPGELAKILATAAKLPEPVAASSSSGRSSSIRRRATPSGRRSWPRARRLQTAEMIKADVDVAATVDASCSRVSRAQVSPAAMSTALESSGHGIGRHRRQRLRRAAFPAPWLLGLLLPLPVAPSGSSRHVGWIEARLLPPPSTVAATLAEL